MKDNANVVVVIIVEERQRNCGGSRRGKTMEIWWF